MAYLHHSCVKYFPWDTVQEENSDQTKQFNGELHQRFYFVITILFFPQLVLNFLISFCGATLHLYLYGLIINKTRLFSMTFHMTDC